jgi:hypothetical protein
MKSLVIGEATTTPVVLDAAEGTRATVNSQSLAPTSTLENRGFGLGSRIQLQSCGDVEITYF